MDRGEDGVHHRAGDGHLGQLEGNSTGVTDDTGTNLDQFECRLVSVKWPHFFRKVYGSAKMCLAWMLRKLSFHLGGVCV